MPDTALLKHATLGDFEQELATTRQLLDRVPEEHLAWAHHRGQLSVYLRLLDVPLPPMYGPTADEAPF